MSVWKSIKQYSLNLVLLAVACLVLEQAIYGFLISGYFSRMLVSPLFWSIFSSVCFWGLWATRDESGVVLNKRNEERYFEVFNPTTMFWIPRGSACDMGGYVYGESPDD